ncbi:hypothetical protein M231_02824 [Tremella mesenterica]|uniref:Zn(2)-C6 fungal-type domain-containing protein n=1 Tax=Tremella mesenterica TaxID=5217 RepID=A0A4Q1BPX6_TREME|nr:uncharacterized protein TREMEDRAFT_66005 [Tremella mesenterica DSM 1558]EIW65919.1 hypothetical protein TREMEDRAFT_66005 [Tremella mesenterica DSM 1558]RXK39890.1 hypothetical protein M231_02824 [Tremella mesenterica]
MHPPPHPYHQYHPPPHSANARKRFPLESATDGLKVHRRHPIQPYATSPDRPDSMSPDKKGKGRPPGQPLRRGDACLMCRAKKLKCSANKPECDQCAKRKDRCVYDAVRPASRVEKLERKLAEIEEAELRAVLAARRHSSELGLAHPNIPHDMNLPPPMPIDFGLYQFQPVPVHISHESFIPQSHETSNESSPHQNTLADPNSWNWSSSNPFDPLSQDPSGVQLDQLPWPLLGASNEVSTLWTGNNPDLPPGGTPSSDTTGMGMDSLHSLGLDHNLESINMNPVQAVLHTPVNHSSYIQNQFHPLSAQSFSSSVPPEAAKAIDGVLSHASAYSEFILTERDISQSAQDYLLDLFFCPPRHLFGSEVFTEAQFRAKCQLSPPERPHPCLLFAMYTVAASGSYIPGVRALADSLYAIATTKLDESIAQEDRVLDAIRASKLLGKWLFNRARALEAHTMTWKSVSLVTACQLDKIPSSTWTPEMLDKRNAIECPWPILGPPKNQYELMERIHAFWGTWGNATGASLMLPWETFIRDDLIRTPLPREPSAYSDGSLVREPDIYLRDIYEMPHGCNKRSNYICFYILTAAHLIHRAKTLRSEMPEHRPTFRELNLRSSAHPQPVRSFCARRDHPAAYQELIDATQHMLKNIPREHQMRLSQTPPWSSPDVPLVHSLLVSVRLFLHDPEGDDYDRDACLDAARELVTMIKHWIQQLMKADQAVNPSCTPGSMPETVDGCGATDKLSSRNKNGVGGPYVLTPWFWTAERLVRGAKVLRGLGRLEEAQTCTDDAASVISGLRSLGVLYPMAQESAEWMDKMSFD